MSDEQFDELIGVLKGIAKSLNNLGGINVDLNRLAEIRRELDCMCDELKKIRQLSIKG